MIHKKSLKNLEKIGYFNKKHPKKIFREKIGPKKILLYILGVMALGGVILGAYAIYLFQTLPNPENFGDRIVAQSTKIYDRTGETLLYEIHGDEKRTVLSLNEIPEYVKEAILSIEDAEFYNHPAFDWRGILRAFITNLKTGKFTQGGSTITQQLVKNAFLTNEKTITRKIKEVILAIKMEKNYSKDEVLGLYLNQIPFGSNAYGIQAASQNYFGKDAKDLTLAESATLAAMLQAPSYYSPYGNHKQELLNRKNIVLEKMKEYGYINESELKTAKKQELTFSQKFNGIRAPHFVMFVKEYLEEKYGTEFVETGGLKVITTLDWNLQQVGEKVVAEGAQRNEELYNGTNAALIAQDASTGQILTMVGSRDYFNVESEGNFNVITGHRQPGSSFKPFAYLTAFEKGYTPDTIVFDVKTEFNPDCPASATQEKDRFGSICYHPSNYDHVFRGPIDLRHSLAQSINVTAVKAMYLAGLNNTIQTAQKLGITTLTDLNSYGLSLVLGGGDVSPIEMAEAYSVFAQDGIKHKQQSILKVEDSKGNVLEEYKDEKEEVFNPQYIRMINDVLSDNEARLGLFSPNNLLEISGHQVAAKTGTTQDYRDAWTFGYTPSLVVGVWAGNNNFTPMTTGSGSILAAVPMWHNFIVEALKDKQPETFPKPESVTTNKPILNGQYMINLKIGDTLYPQIHNILYWVKKSDPQGAMPENPSNDPQFNNWEIPVLNWVQANVPNAGSYNLTVPAGYGEVVSGNNKPMITIASPGNGSYLTTDYVSVLAQIKTSTGVKSIKTYFNDILITQTDNFTGDTYHIQFIPQTIEAQNKIKIEVIDKLGQTNETSIIIFKQ
ncbi:MAG TPA: transglycosylase domain-containing protein [Candidatus Paceibacterota bacterium]|nr:transglycosylase domain-containing protein [Candidatus Paceibacterota bacterium]HPT40345.1 transglycosylase domain-containing protein [Candidatus Paceibacterota bacterium]